MLTYIQNIECISPIGKTWTTTWDQLLHGENYLVQYNQHNKESAIDFSTSFCNDIDRRIKEFGKLLGGGCVEISLQCIANILANINVDEEILFFGGSTNGEAELLIKNTSTGIEKTAIDSFRKGRLIKSLSIEVIPLIIKNVIPKNINIRSWIYSSCVSSLHALLIAILDCQRNNKKHLVLGVDVVNHIEVSGFNKVGAMTKTKCAPFDKMRDGILISEGAVTMLISNERNKNNIAIVGFGMSCDAGDPTAPANDGFGLELAINEAMKNAEISYNDVGAIILHGTGTRINDSVEAKIILKIFNNTDVPITSIKGTLGHTMGAAGLFNVATAYNSLLFGKLPPASKTIIENEYGLNIVCSHPAPIDIRKAILITAIGFGGNNVAIILKRQE